MAERAVVISRKLCKVDTVQIDACREENHQLTNTVTSHPVEEGADVSDHSRPNPDVVSLAGFISNTPLSVEQKTRAVQEGAVKFQTTAAEARTIGQTGRAIEAYEKLRKLRDEGTLVKVVTSLREYGNEKRNEGMVIESLTIPRSSRNYDGIEFTLVLKQIKIVRNRKTSFKEQQEDKRTAPKKDKGHVAPKQEDDKRSLLTKANDSETGKNLTDGVAGAIKGLGKRLGF